jgi:EF-hand domain pair
MRQLFRYCDKDGSGSIDKEELGSVMHELGRDLSPDELTTLMNQLDVDGNGDIDFDEFLEGMGKWFLSPTGDNKQATEYYGNYTRKKIYEWVPYPRHPSFFFYIYEKVSTKKKWKQHVRYLMLLTRMGLEKSIQMN